MTEEAWFKACMETVAKEHQHILQNIPVEVYAGALALFEEFKKQKGVEL